jgi:monovalent cation/proton antiporter MnhG/PhaG subunit
MSASDLLIDVLLALGVAIELVACLGVLVMRDVYDRLHYTGPASTLGPAAIGAAVLVREGFSQAGFKVLLVAALLAFLNPILVHATARSARIREHGSWEPSTGERRRLS